MLKIEINREPTPKGQLMSDRELTKILAMINSKVKRGVTITYVFRYLLTMGIMYNASSEFLILVLQYLRK
jgi:hypothetical protein